MKSYKETIDLQQSQIDAYLLELAKEYKKENRNATPVEMILVGGASVLINFSFRSVTTDADAYISSYSTMKGAIHRVAEKYNLSMEWLNDDFTKTASFSARIREHSKHYKSFLGYLDVRTVTDEYLIAMKLMSGRVYKHDLSDVVGVLYECHLKGYEISRDIIVKAVEDLYESWDVLPKASKDFIDEVFTHGATKEYFESIVNRESNNLELLVEHISKGGEVKPSSNISELLDAIKDK